MRDPRAPLDIVQVVGASPYGGGTVCIYKQEPFKRSRIGGLTWP